MPEAPDEAHVRAVTDKRTRNEPFRGVVVELIRLVLVAVCAVAGWQIAEQVTNADTSSLLGIVLGSAIGYVLGGVIGRGTVSAVGAIEREFRQVPAAELLAGTIGMILGLIVASLLSIVIFKLPPLAAGPTAAFVFIVMAFFGYRLGRSKRDDFFGIFGLKTRTIGSRSEEVSVVDTSALIDGRLLEVLRTGFLGGTFLILRGVLDELQTIADSSDPSRRERGRRGLEILHSLQRSANVALIDEDGEGDVDARVIRVARERGGVVITCDANLAKVAQALDVPVRSLHELASAVRQPFVAGEGVTVHLSKEGREHGQGVGYLEDGTMVVVQDGKELLGSVVEVTVTNVLQTATGRLVFAKLAER